MSKTHLAFALSVALMAAPTPAQACSLCGGDWGGALLNDVLVPVLVVPPSAFAAIALLAVDGVLLSDLSAGRPLSANKAAAGVVLGVVNAAIAAAVMGVNLEALRTSPGDAGARTWAVGGGVALSVALGLLAFSSVMLWRARQPQVPTATVPQVSVTPWATAHGGGLSLSGNW
jgi:hypothetical protein